MYFVLVCIIRVDRVELLYRRTRQTVFVLAFWHTRNENTFCILFSHIIFPLP